MTMMNCSFTSKYTSKIKIKKMLLYIKCWYLAFQSALQIQETDENLKHGNSLFH